MSGDLISQIEKNDLFNLYSKMLADLNLGELLQDSFENFEISKIEENFDFCCFKTYCKTSTLFSNSAKGLAIIYDLNEKQIDLLDKIGSTFGLIFQFKDDFLDILIRQEGTNLDKESYKDIRDGIYTFNFQIYITDLFLKDEKKAEEFLSLYYKKLKTNLEIKFLVKEMNRENILEYQRLYIQHLFFLCLNYLKEFGQTFENENFSQSIFFNEFYKLLNFIVERKN